MTETKKSSPDASALPGETEKEYLERQMAAAKRAIGETLGSMKEEAKTAASPAAWTREHPWAALAASAAAGVAAALILAPKRGESVKDQWYKVKVNLSGDAGDASAASAEVEAPGKRSFLATAAVAAFSILKPVILELLRSARQPADVAQGNGVSEPGASNAGPAEES